MTNRRISPQIRMNTGESGREAFERFLLFKRADGVKIKSLESYSQHFKAISYHLDIDKNIDEWTKNDLAAMIESMQSHDLSPNTIKSYTIALKAFFSWCNNEGLTSLNIAIYKGEDTIKETYTDDELALLLQKPNMKKCSFADYRSWVIINLLVNCGCRAGTIRSIQNRDVDFSGSVIRARHTKNGKPLTIPLCSEMVSVLREYMKIRNGDPDDFLFCNEGGAQLTENGLRCSIANYNRRRGVEKTSIHLFRHTFARKYLVDCGGNAFTLQKLLGHSTLDMTKHYCAIFDADIARNFDSFSPLSQFKAKSEKIKMPARRR